MLKKIKKYIRSGCRVGLYTNKQISYQRQPKVIAKSNKKIAHRRPTSSNYQANQAFNCHTRVNYPPQKIFCSFVAFNSFL